MHGVSCTKDLEVYSCLLYTSHSKVKEEVVSQLAEIKDIVRNGTVRAAISGSAGLGLAESAGLPFVQEVFATKAALSLIHI